jgi:hypothetical protein
MARQKVPHGGVVVLLQNGRLGKQAALSASVARPRGPPRPVDPNAGDGSGPVRIVNSVCLSCGTRMGARLMRPKEISLKRTRFAPTPHYLLEA